MGSREVYWILGSLMGVLAIASAAGYALRLNRPDNPAIRNLNARIRSWWILVLIGGAALLAGRVASTLLFAVVSLLALREFLTAIPGRSPDRAAWRICAFIVLPVQYVLAWTQWHQLFSIWIPLCAIPVFALAMFPGHARRFFDRASVALWGVLICVYSISHIPALMTLRIPGFETRTPLLMVFLVLIVQSSDVLQYVWGKLLGKHPLAPAISPSKTVEGLIGGVLSATLVGALLWGITPFRVWQAAGMALLIAILGVVGGLVMSAIKRERGIKDWGNLIQGHGGMLDRIDSLCFSAPVFFYLTRYIFSRRIRGSLA